MPGGLGVRRLSYHTLRKIAESFLAQHHPSKSIPVPIEEIVDLRFQLDIVPLPGLHQLCDTDAFITSDLRTIYVDDLVYASRPSRYRFSLAHELFHLILHREIFRKLSFSSIAEWKKTVHQIPEADYGWLEWQAYALAGLILVPPETLARRFHEAASSLAKAGLSLRTASEAARHMLVGNLAKQFDVSTQVVDKRILKDELWPSP